MMTTMESGIEPQQPENPFHTVQKIQRAVHKRDYHPGYNFVDETGYSMFLELDRLIELEKDQNIRNQIANEITGLTEQDYPKQRPGSFVDQYWNYFDIENCSIREYGEELRKLGFDVLYVHAPSFCYFDTELGKRDYATLISRAFDVNDDVVKLIKDYAIKENKRHIFLGSETLIRAQDSKNPQGYVWVKKIRFAVA